MKFLWILALASSLWAAGHTCGTMQALENLTQKRGPVTVAATEASKQCATEDYYDSVFTKKTTHFQIFYTLKGPHATTKAYIDTLAVQLEKGWKFHVEKNKMLSPLGVETSLHFLKPVQSGLYPVEVIELNLVRNPKTVYGSKGFCEDCFAVTSFKNRNEYQKSELIIDNDFVVMDLTQLTSASLEVNGKTCSYWKSTKEITHSFYNYSYAKEWAKAIRVTVYHELYHAIQVRYLSPYEHLNFWYEASATGMEELGAPDINDYFRYIPEFLGATGIPMDDSDTQYGASLFFLYLHNHVGASFDKSLWEAFSKNPERNFRQQLSHVLEDRKESPQDRFQDFAQKLALSGNRAVDADSSQWISVDQPNWSVAPYHYAQDGFLPDSSIFAYNFYVGGTPDISNYSGKVSAILFKDGHAKFRTISDKASMDSLLVEKFNADSLVWVFSRFENPSPLPDNSTQKSLRAYPTPWRGGPLCFSPLPLDKEFIEIRNRRGDLLFREKYSESTHCLEESFIKSKMVPGVYRYRAGSSGKTKDFIIIY